MRRTKVELKLSIDELKRFCDEYLVDCQYRGHKPKTISDNRADFEHFFWFLRQQGWTQCGQSEIKAFLLYLQQTPGPKGRWDNPRLTRAVRPVTVRSYYRCLATFFKWLVEEEILSFNPMEKVKAPPVRTPLKEPLSAEQVGAMLQAAKTSRYPQRNTAMLLFLLDTGVRATELCGLRQKDLDMKNRSARIFGKGNKIRTVFFGIGTSRALYRYLRMVPRDEESPVFYAHQSNTDPKRGSRRVPMTASGLLQLMRRLGEVAGVRCGCHDWRRTFAVNILNNGANLIAVSRMMGHETLEITKGYLALSQTDIQEQHRQFSPADRMKK